MKRQKIIIGGALAVAAFFLFSGRSANASEVTAADIEGLDNSNAGSQEPGGIFSALLGQLAGAKFTPSANVDDVGDDNSNAMVDKGAIRVTPPPTVGVGARDIIPSPAVVAPNPNLPRHKQFAILDEGRNRANTVRFGR